MLQMPKLLGERQYFPQMAFTQEGNCFIWKHVSFFKDQNSTLDAIFDVNDVLIDEQQANLFGFSGFDASAFILSDLPSLFKLLASPLRHYRTKNKHKSLFLMEVLQLI
jgi:hypothetical protein